ncbi:unnamed protein product [Amoebophrya sp. A25]|nr:unnamed protein product [Amoebophrya sp. A25]|eukprot:GSA25T00017356001.1
MSSIMDNYEPDLENYEEQEQQQVEQDGPFLLALASPLPLFLFDNNNNNNFMMNIFNMEQPEDEGHRVPVPDWYPDELLRGG